MRLSKPVIARNMWDHYWYVYLNRDNKYPVVIPFYSKYWQECIDYVKGYYLRAAN